ncbi:hypothetical protein PHYPO_G00055840 [Pangasianodon hypophthalmus]|uniref:Uncharacterized protein n=1 Tax=Pangasianodon hypophthalmus TaxID=310915 RepID=A0A5N5M6N7_PANHP|nr:hypothetical protein PHYPO_G00055840 [Pangasianodon hypophthalmus]
MHGELQGLQLGLARPFSIFQNYATGHTAEERCAAQYHPPLPHPQPRRTTRDRELTSRHVGGQTLSGGASRVRTGAINESAKVTTSPVLHDCARVTTHAGKALGSFPRIKVTPLTGSDCHTPTLTKPGCQLTKLTPSAKMGYN